LKNNDVRHVFHRSGTPDKPGDQGTGSMRGMETMGKGQEMVEIKPFDIDDQFRFQNIEGLQISPPRTRPDKGNGQENRKDDEKESVKGLTWHLVIKKFHSVIDNEFISVVKDEIECN
jgi:hypothetical protein